MMTDTIDGNDDDGTFPWVVMGRTIGTIAGWDQFDVFIYGLYDFKPEQGISIPPGDVTLDYAEGTWRVYDDTGMVDAFGDLVDVVKGIEVQCLN